MKKHSLVFVLLLAGSLILSGCGGEDQSSKAPQESPAASQDSTETEEALSRETETPPTDETGSDTEPATEPVTEPPTETAFVPVPDGSNGILTDSGLFPNVSELSNKSIPYGNDWEAKDEKTGLASGVFWYEAKWGKYFPVYRIKTDKPVVYLTMDEGYEAGYTPKILDVLKEKNVKAVFFLTKQFVDSDPDLVRRMIAEGHILGNHTCRHPSGGYPRYVDEHGIDSFVEDVSQLHKIVYDRFGYTMRLFRFPEGESSDMLMAKLDNLGYISVFWSYAHKDYDRNNQPEVSVTLNRCLSHLGKGAVYLLHAVSESNTEALADFIDGARERGYEFGVFPVSEVLQPIEH
ncbi:MAG: polysaccharide deacetylase family protein [Lachnospiraceae bacterium]|nr:polysaccharide deacetylase family protein [Lachnospiraceae bacterium]